MQFIIEPVKRKTKKNAKIKLQCPEECTDYCELCSCFDPSCGGKELCMDGLNCPQHNPCWPGYGCIAYPCPPHVCPPHV